MKIISTMTKNRSAFLKRFKITKKGKILRRIAGISHNLSKKESIVKIRKKKIKKEDDLVLDYLNY